MMDVEKLIEQLSIRGLGNGTSLGYHSGLFDEAATALSAQQAENEKLRDELERCKEKNAGLALALLTECAPNPDCLGNDEWRAIRSELEQVKRTLAMMWFAYVNSDKEDPHNYETEALEEAERLLGPWKECMPKYLRRGPKEG